MYLYTLLLLLPGCVVFISKRFILYAYFDFFNLCVIHNLNTSGLRYAF